MIYKARGVSIGNRRTTIRLPPVMWEALEDIARYQSHTLADLLRQIEDGREPEQGLTDAIRIYIVQFNMAPELARAYLPGLTRRG